MIQNLLFSFGLSPLEKKTFFKSSVLPLLCCQNGPSGVRCIVGVKFLWSVPSHYCAQCTEAHVVTASSGNFSQPVTRDNHSTCTEFKSCFQFDVIGKKDSSK